jgi:hypothetical protein
VQLPIDESDTNDEDAPLQRHQTEDSNLLDFVGADGAYAPFLTR